MADRTVKPGTQEFELMKNENPPPNAYSLPNNMEAKNIEMAARMENKIENGVPGPGTYDPMDGVKAIKKKLPASSLAGRTDLHLHKESWTSPCSYNIGSTLLKRGITMGKRTSLAATGQLK